MSLQDEHAEVVKLLESIEKEEKDTTLKAAELNAQIAALRLELDGLKEVKFRTRQKRTKAERDKESLERKLQLEKEAKALEDAFEARWARAQGIIANAPWKDVAFEWQLKGAVRLPDRALLGDKRGLGKTLSSIIWRRVHECKRTLVCLRKEVAYDFLKELYLREPGLGVWPLIGANQDQRKTAAFLLKNVDEFVVVTNIESWRRDAEGVADALLDIKFDSVILDEAHHIKNAGTGTAQGFFRIADSVPKVLELTGTPIKNRPQEMFSLLHALYPENFTSEKHFLWDYCVNKGPNRWVFSERGLVNLVKKIDHFYIARTREDVGIHLPPPNIIEYELDMEAHLQQKQAYKMITERNMAILNSGQAIGIMHQLAIMTRQAQVMSWPAGIEFKIPNPLTGETDRIRFDVHESVKTDWAEDLIEELTGEGERAIFFSRFVPVIEELRSRLEKKGISVAVITGDEKGNKEEIFDDFDLKTAPENPKYQVLLATYQTVGESANLNAATHVILYDTYWNPGNEDQAIGRVDRLNSVTQATVHIPVVKNTIDVYMRALVAEKREIVDDFKGAAAMQASLKDHLAKSL